MAETAQQNQDPQAQEVQVPQVQQPAPVAEQNGNPPAPPGAAQEVTFYFFLFSHLVFFSSALMSFISSWSSLAPEQRYTVVNKDGE